jgi:hypothetical protein
LDVQIPLTVEQIRARARWYREMAQTAATFDTRNGLIRLAERFEALATEQEEREKEI